MTRPPALAWLAIAVTVTIWASFLVVTRAAMTSQLGPVEVGLIRSGVGALFFLPLILRRGLRPPGAGWRELTLIPLCGGFLFVIFLGLGLQRAPVADSGVFTPSMLPVYVAVLSALFLGERFTRLRLAGFALIVFGAVAVGGFSALSRSGDVWSGHLLFTLASISWAVYTLVFRLSGLRAEDGAAILSFWSALAFLAVGLFTGISFAGVGAGPLAIQILFQGVLSGFVANFTFFYAVHHLGPSRSAAFAALVPVLAALGGWLFLGEPIGLLKATGIAIVVAGVLLASGVFRARSTSGLRP
ncbi:DMT family transporter [Algicella marina]|uniref:EamA family transporter n=1 Tax=Algicella marina TaxID=2683284 RepID=A0A6P1SYA3_9RHOB|nr:DMT family transporter [Algicella marina]QHQ34471.1 EamA family transporter [Algicella marina]